MIVGLFHLVLYFLAGLSFGHHVAAELARDDDYGAGEQAAFFKIANQTRDRAVDGLLHRLGPDMSVLVRVPVTERNVLGGDFDEANAVFHETAREQAAEPKSPGVVCVIRFLGLECEIECFRRRRLEQSIRIVQRTHADSRADSRCRRA